MTALRCPACAAELAAGDEFTVTEFVRVAATKLVTGQGADGVVEAESMDTNVESVEATRYLGCQACGHEWETRRPMRFDGADVGR